MAGHILILRTPLRHGEQYLVRLIQQFRASDRFGEHPIQILTREFPDGLPESVRELGGVVQYQGASDVDSLRAVDVDEADVIVVLAKDESDNLSDGHTFDILHRLSELGARGSVLAECVDDRNRERLMKAGADMVIRPTRAYPGVIVRSLVAPGSEQIFENLVIGSSDEYKRYDVDIADKTWGEVVCALITSDVGTAVAYVDRQDGTLYCNPPAGDPVDAIALIVMVRSKNVANLRGVRNALDL